MEGTVKEHGAMGLVCAHREFRFCEVDMERGRAAATHGGGGGFTVACAACSHACGGRGGGIGCGNCRDCVAERGGGGRIDVGVCGGVGARCLQHMCKRRRQRDIIFLGRCRSAGAPMCGRRIRRCGSVGRTSIGLQAPRQDMVTSISPVAPWSCTRFGCRWRMWLLPCEGRSWDAWCPEERHLD